jgi:hypothetical protein
MRDTTQKNQTPTPLVSVEVNPQFAGQGDKIEMLAEVLVSQSVRSNHSPRPVMECVVRAIQGDAGDDLTKEQYERFEISRTRAKFTISRFELPEGSIFVLFFSDGHGVFVGSLHDVRSIFQPNASKPHPFDTSDNRKVLMALIPLKEGEVFIDGKEYVTPNSVKQAFKLAVTLNPSADIRPELN